MSVMHLLHCFICRIVMIRLLNLLHLIASASSHRIGSDLICPTLVGSVAISWGSHSSVRQIRSHIFLLTYLNQSAWAGAGRPPLASCSFQLRMYFGFVHAVRHTHHFPLIILLLLLLLLHSEYSSSCTSTFYSITGSSLFFFPFCYLHFLFFDMGEPVLLLCHVACDVCACHKQADVSLRCD